MDPTPWIAPRLRRRLLAALLGWGGLAGGTLHAQEPIAAPIAVGPAATLAAPAPPLGLQDCLTLAFEKQPALAAARSSLAAAIDGSNGVNNLRFAAIVSKDIPIRREQACVGITVAQARLTQAEWETRYAVTRNFYTIQYVRAQQIVVKNALGKLEKGRKTAERLVNAGELTKVTRIDIDTMDINIDLLRAKETELTSGIEKARGALREAIGIGPDCPLLLVPEALPALVTDLDRQALVAAGVAQRGEIAQAQGAHRITDLEVIAQERKRGIQVPTFASGSDIHAVPVPQGINNREYRPGALGIEMPPTLIGHKSDRVQRAADLAGRSVAVVDKALNLVALEIDNYYLNWQEAKQKIERLDPIRKRAASVGQKVETRFTEGNASGEEYLRASTLSDQVDAQYNEAVYLHALALAALERTTAGYFRINPTTAGPQP